MRSEINLSQLEADLAQRRQELAELERDVTALAHVVAMYRRSSNSATPDAENPLPVAPHLSSSDLGSPRRTSSELSRMFRDAAYQYLTGRVRPTPTRELFDAISTMGFEIPGENPAGNLSAHLSRDPRFMSFGRDGWQLSDTIERSESALNSVVTGAASKLDSVSAEEFREALRLNPGGSLPAETDSLLLAEGREQLGRHFTDEEKRFVRRAFRNHFIGETEALT